MIRVILGVDARLVAADLTLALAGIVPDDAASAGADGLLARVGRRGTRVIGVTRALAATEALLRTALPPVLAGCPRRTTDTTGSGDLALVAFSEGFLGCSRQCAAEQHAEQRAEGRTTGSGGGQSARESVEAISIHGFNLNELERKDHSTCQMSLLQPQTATASGAM
jgi:hypothetical protein